MSILNRDLVAIVAVIVSMILTVLGVVAYIVYIMGGLFYLLVHAVGIGASLGYVLLFLLSIAGLFFIIEFLVIIWMVVFHE